jgi:hypothetical protein
MRTFGWFSALLAVPFTVLAVTSSAEVADFPSRAILQRQKIPAPPPCRRQNPPPSESETRAKFDQFVQVFVGPRKNITNAFEYIAADYIVSLHFKCAARISGL